MHSHHTTGLMCLEWLNAMKKSIHEWPKANSKAYNSDHSVF
jgi:hypothetical protein